ncbi:MAG: transcription-repair coupling factor [Proteobacteria bacterium]|nr:transcription-repair coupling factor [Pseudomonadota bacterium]
MTVSAPAPRIADLADRLSGPGRVLIANAPEGLDALLLAELATARGPDPVLHVARDDVRMARLAATLGFFAPEAEVLTFPAWDCLPYDRVGPHRDILARRIDTLTRLIEAAPAPGGRVVITTVNALLQRVPPGTAFAGRVLEGAPGARLELEALTGYFARNGYLRAETVGEPGEFALRGGIVDVFPPGEEQPLRLDFFGDELESIRRFDPLSQRTTGTAAAFRLKPVNEVILEPEAIARFRAGYLRAFGAVRGADPLYEAVSAGRRHPGMEHWLPLFHEELVTLFDYLPAAAVTLDHQAEEARGARLETIADYFGARKNLEGGGAIDGSTYKPLDPELLYLSAADWDARLAERAVGQFSPFAAPEHRPEVFDAQGRRGRDFAEARASAETNLFDAVDAHIAAEQAAGRRVLVVGYSAGTRDRLGALLHEHGLPALVPVETWAEARALPGATAGLTTLEIETGFAAPEASFITEQDILGERIARPPRKRRRAEDFLTEVTALHEGDFVVHVEHGIGRYEGLVALDVHGAPHDCLKVVYQGGDRLFVPVENIEVLSRFGSEDAEVDLDRLGGANWQARKARVKRRLRNIADRLIKVAAARAMNATDPLEPPAGLYDEFAARFPYPETEDQDRAIDDTLADLAAGRPMDRLICGDVGFGKTEVALRAAFVTVMEGKQVAVVVPTTLLCRQHHQTFRERFAGLPVRIEAISRLVGAKKVAAAKAGLKDGQVDIVIGTHALLGKTIEFRDLALLVVDEEQHFGVRQKERLKELRESVHVLTLSATPIPRTLQLAMSGVKEMSLIATPPVDRLAVRTFVLPYDPVVVREAILREHFRGGQIFYVCPRVEDLAGLEARLAKLVPEVKLGVAHGQMAARDLENVMSAFYDRRFDLLLSTNIIESGLDIPNANTIVVHRSDMFGLSQLYQLRGRIGRSKVRGYAYLTLPPGRLLKPAAEKRLGIMQTLDTLGAGFTLASHDMDIRGAGNLIGEEQSGHIREVGVELYQQMLEEAVTAARAGGAAAGEGEAAAEAFTPQISIGTSIMIPEAYVADLGVRLGLYRRLSRLVDKAEIEGFAAELIDRFGPLPEEVENLLQVVAIKRLCRDAGIDKVEAGPKGAVVSFYKDRFAKPAELVAFIQRQAGTVKLRPDHKLVYRRQWDDPAARLRGVRRLLDELAKVAG